MNTLHDSLASYQSDTAKILGTKSAKKKIQKLKTVLFQVLYPIMGQPNHSRNQNKALLEKIPVQGLIEAYNEKVRAEIEKLKSQKDKSAPAYESSWNHFISWLSDRSDYRSEPVTAIIETEELSFPLKARHGKGLNSNLPKENPNRPHLVYALKEKQLSPKLQTFLQKLAEFCRILTPEEENRLHREKTRKQKKDGIRETSFNSYKGELLRYLGWLTTIYLAPDTDQPLPLDEITIEHLYSETLLKAYIDWHLNVRGNTFTTVHQGCNLAVKVAQCDLEQEIGISRLDAHPIVQSLMKLRSQYDPEKGEHPRTSVAALEKRLLEHHECEEIVKYLAKKAKHIEQQWREGKIEGRKNVEDAWQDYLIIALLTYGAMRQREIREMKQKGKRFYFNASEGVYWCCLFPADH